MHNHNILIEKNEKLADLNEKKPELKIFECHHCNCKLTTETGIKCQKEICGRYFCKDCLTRLYKYSTISVRQLPSRSWACPHCKFKCNVKK